jgi:hypothetical protein
MLGQPADGSPYHADLRMPLERLWIELKENPLTEPDYFSESTTELSMTL